MSESSTIFRPEVDRLEVLWPSAHQLWSLIKQQEDQSGPLRMTVRKYEVDISPWEKAQLADLIAAPKLDPDRWSYRLLEALAVQVRGLNDAVRFDDAQQEGSEPLEAVRRDLIVDLALGFAIHAELRAVVAELEAAGKTSHARNLGRFVDSLRKNLEPVEAVMGESERNVAAEVARGMTGTVRSQSSEMVTTEIESCEPDAASERLRSRPAKKVRRRSKLAPHASLILIALFTFAATAAIVFFAPKWLDTYDVSKGLRYVQGVSRYTGAPPTMKVTVNPEHWRRLEGVEKTSLVFAVAAAIGREGYTSATFVTPDGKTVGKWSKHAGVSFD